MSKVFVLDADRRPLMPCTPARARLLLKQQKAAVLRHYPFTVAKTHYYANITHYRASAF